MISWVSFVLTLFLLFFMVYLFMLWLTLCWMRPDFRPIEKCWKHTWLKGKSRIKAFLVIFYYDTLGALFSFFSSLSFVALSLSAMFCFLIQACRRAAAAMRPSLRMHDLCMAWPLLGQARAMGLSYCCYILHVLIIY